jgi:hypothetical protein
MPRYFFDTSALVKNYHAEAGTAEVQRILADTSSEFLISRLATVEMLSGFAGKVRTGTSRAPTSVSSVDDSSRTSGGGR